MRKSRRRMSFLAGFLVLLAGAFGPVRAAEPSPYEILRNGHAARSPAEVASAYSLDAVFVPPGHRPLRGREAIARYYAELFRRIPGQEPLDLNFRLAVEGTHASGFSRLRTGGAGGDAPVFSRFATVLRPDSDGVVRIASMRAARTSEARFEEARGPVLFAADAEQLGGFYDSFLGRYRGPRGCEIVVTRTLRRLWARDVCSLEWRSLVRVSGREWTAGDRLLSDKVELSYRFQGPGLHIAPAGGRGPSLLAKRIAPYRIEPVRFKSADGTSLAGQIWIPSSNARRIGVVLAHGSGAQDRNGYASILAVLADALASRGYAVLTYDKRGAGRSEGDWSRASFATLSDDLAAGLAALNGRKDLVDSGRVGIGGSSQAGWVSAKAVERGAAPWFVFLVGAGGSAMPVTVQNRYNVGVSMRCAGFTEAQIATVLDQNEAFYAFRRDSRTASALDAATARARRDARLEDWLLPDSQQLDATGAAWYSVMEIEFDPVPVWRGFPGKLIFVQGDRDDQTPVAEVRARLAGFSPEKLTLRVLDGAQHLGVRARDVCEGMRLEDLSRFHPGLFEAIDALAETLAD